MAEIAFAGWLTVLVVLLAYRAESRDHARTLERWGKTLDQWGDSEAQHKRFLAAIETTLNRKAP